MARSSFPTGQVIRIAVTVALLVAVLITKQRCGKATVELFRALDQRPHIDGGVDGGAQSTPKALTPVDAAH
jgi:hypothetical protein